MSRPEACRVSEGVDIRAEVRREGNRRAAFKAAILGGLVGLVLLADSLVPPGPPPRRAVPYMVTTTALDPPESHGYREADGFLLWEPWTEQSATVQDRSSWIPVADAYALGGSVALGSGASSPDHAWHRGLGLEPAASGSWVSAQERVCLELVLLPRHPKLVVLVDGWNDVANPALTGSRPGDPHGFEIASPPSWPHVWTAKRRNDLSAALRARAVRILADPPRLESYLATVSASYLDSTARLLERCREAGVPCRAFFQPCRQLVAPSRTPEEELVARAARRVLADGLPDGVANLGTIVPVERYVDTCHFDDRGQVLLREAVRSKITDTFVSR